MNELNFSLAEFPETVNHRGDTSDYERSIVRYLMNYGAEALAAIKAAGLNRNLLFTESAYQVMKACEVLDDQGRLPSEPCFPALNEHFLTLSRDELRNDTGKYETPLEAADLMAVAMEGLSHNQRMGERVLEDYVKAIIGAYHYKAKLQIAYAYFDALKKPGISIDRVTIETGNRMEALMQQVTQEGGATIDDATQDALTLHDYLQHEMRTGSVMPSFGMPMLDEAFMLMPGSYTCLMGFPGSGKTTFAMQMANTTAASRLQVHFVSFEMSLAQLGAKRISCETGIDVGKIQSGKMSYEERQQAGEFQKCEYMEIVDDGEPNTEWLENHLTSLAVRANKPAVVIIDHLHILMPMKGQHSYDMLNEASKSIARFCKKTNIPVIALVQMTTGSTAQITDKLGSVVGYKEPTMGDIRGSGAIAQDMSGLLMIWPQESEGTNTRTTICIGKNRFGDIGKIDTTFEKANSRFTNARSHEGSKAKGPQKDSDDLTEEEKKARRKEVAMQKAAEKKEREAAAAKAKQLGRLSANEIYGTAPTDAEDLYAQ